MSLISFHRFLISGGILFCLGYAAWELAAYGRTDATGSLAIAAVFGLLAIALMVYLWKLSDFLGLDRRGGEGSR